jgi:hypothetical protein
MDVSRAPEACEHEVPVPCLAFVTVNVLVLLSPEQVDQDDQLPTQLVEAGAVFLVEEVPPLLIPLDPGSCLVSSRRDSSALSAAVSPMKRRRRRWMEVVMFCWHYCTVLVLVPE